MDDRLKERLQKIRKQIDAVFKAEGDYLSLDAAKDHKLAKLVIHSRGSSQVARETEARSTEEWGQFRKDLAHAESVFHREKHMLELKNSAFQAEYLNYKIEVAAIKRGVE